MKYVEAEEKEVTCTKHGQPTFHWQNIRLTNKDIIICKFIKFVIFTEEYVGEMKCLKFYFDVFLLFDKKNSSSKTIITKKLVHFSEMFWKIFDLRFFFYIKCYSVSQFFKYCVIVKLNWAKSYCMTF